MAKGGKLICAIIRLPQEAIYIKFVGPIEQMIVEKEEIR